ncbi:TMEM164 family acyltransferase, partial [Streptococcus ferus]
DFPHITAVSFIIGHYALLVNSLVYLLGQYQMHLLQKRQIISYTLVLNFFLVLVNQITGGNYGILRHPPFITDDYLSLNYLVVSVVLIAMLLLLNHLFVIKYQKEV